MISVHSIPPAIQKPRNTVKDETEEREELSETVRETVFFFRVGYDWTDGISKPHYEKDQVDGIKIEDRRLHKYARFRIL